jgi:hypothetical protein
VTLFRWRAGDFGGALADLSDHGAEAGNVAAGVADGRLHGDRLARAECAAGGGLREAGGLRDGAEVGPGSKIRQGERCWPGCRER